MGLITERVAIEFAMGDSGGSEEVEIESICRGRSPFLLRRGGISSIRHGLREFAGAIMGRLDDPSSTATQAAGSMASAWQASSYRPL